VEARNRQGPSKEQNNDEYFEDLHGYPCVARVSFVMIYKKTGGEYFTEMEMIKLNLI
jgi:hypothetical protein